VGFPGANFCFCKIRLSDWWIHFCSCDFCPRLDKLLLHTSANNEFLPYTLWWDCKLVQPLRKSIWKFLKN
jgi:hypothetical protein